LDLDFNTSLEMAKSLSMDYKGDPNLAKKDFFELVDFCTDEKALGLSRPQCGVIAGRIVKKAENFNVSILDKFVEIFNFMISDKGPSPDLLIALTIAEEITAIGPEAPENFIMAYKYGINESGLSLPAARALSFAKRISKNAVFKLENKPERLPAAAFPDDDLYED
jgi:hypothetical protein